MPDSSGNKAGSNENELFQRAFDNVLNTEKKDYPSYIGGLSVASGKDYELASPIDSTIIFGRFQIPERGTVAQAVRYADEAFASWSKKSGLERAELFANVLKRVKAQRYRLASYVMLSTGMVLKDCLAEADGLAVAIEKACEDEISGEGSPAGVWGILSDHVSPLAFPAASAVCAMVSGNTVVCIPSVQCPVPMFVFYGILVAAGIPPGVFNIVVGGPEADVELAGELTVKGIAASVSGKRAEELIFLPVDDELIFVNEIKGMNPIAVYKPKDMKAAAASIIESAFRSSGQRQYSCSKVITTHGEREKLVSELLEAVKSVKIGDPAEDGTTAGPIISKKDYENYLALANELRSEIIYGGESVSAQGGHYVRPMIISGSEPETPTRYSDMGLPILTVVSVADFEGIMEEMEETECGLSASIFTRNESSAEIFERDAEAETINVNHGTENTVPALTVSRELFLK